MGNRCKKTSYQKRKERLSNYLQNLQKEQTHTLRLQKNTSNLFRPRAKDKSDQTIDVRSFHGVIQINKEALTADVEGMTTYEELVNETLKEGFLPAVVPELKTITIGGAIAGCGIESSSFRYGLVHETVEEIDALLSSGKVITCNRENKYQDLFYSLPNTFGTLGYALRVKVKLIPIKPYIKLTHFPFSQIEEFFKEIERLSLEKAYDYVEGVVFHAKEQVITVAEFVDRAPYLSDYTYRHIYYRSLQTRKEDYLTTHDYIWRWDSDWFWCSDVFFMQNSLLRPLLGRFFLGSKIFGKVMHYFHDHPTWNRVLEKFYGKRESIIQDISIPVDQAALFYRFFEETIGIYPLWICPTKAYSEKDSFTFCPMEEKKLYLDFGFWKSIPSSHEEGYFNRLIEDITKRLGGFKSLYSSCFYTEEEFWSIYNRDEYKDLKEKYDPEGKLRGLYEKCHTKSST